MFIIKEDNYAGNYGKFIRHGLSDHSHHPWGPYDQEFQRQCAISPVRDHGSGFGFWRLLPPHPPGALALNTTGLASFAVSLGIGKLITSITMTFFYILLYYVWRARYKIQGKTELTVAVYILSAIRIALCLFPQNQWTSLTPPLSWGIYRNIPFAVLGILIIVLFYRSSRAAGDLPFRNMALTIVLSFAFYIPVVLLADVIPLLGILMIPKTCAYVWSIWIGFSDMRKQQRAASPKLTFCPEA